MCVCVATLVRSESKSQAQATIPGIDTFLCPYSLYCLCLMLFFFFFNSSFISALETVDADKVYVLGGLVDESIQKVLHNKTEGHSATNRLVQSDWLDLVSVLCSGQTKASISCNWHHSSKMHMCSVMSWISTNCFFFSPTCPAEVELFQGTWPGHPHGEAAHRRVHGEEAQPQELPLKDPGDKSRRVSAFNLQVYRGCRAKDGNVRRLDFFGG